MITNLNATAEAALNVLEHQPVLEFEKGGWRIVTLEIAIEYVVRLTARRQR